MSDRTLDELLRDKPVSDAVKTRVIQQFTPMVAKFTKRLDGSVHGSGDTREDIINEGILALIQAAERYTPDRVNPKNGLKATFFTFAHSWVWGSMRNAVRGRNGLIRIPRNILDEVYTQTEGSYTEEGRKALGVKGFPTSDDGSTYEPADYRERRELPDFEEIEALRRSLRYLPLRWRTVVSLRLGIEGEGPYTLDQVGERIGVTRERVRQIAKPALERFMLWLQWECRKQGLEAPHPSALERLAAGIVPAKTYAVTQ